MTVPRLYFPKTTTAQVEGENIAMSILDNSTTARTNILIRECIQNSLDVPISEDYIKPVKIEFELFKSKLDILPDKDILLDKIVQCENFQDELNSINRRKAFTNAKELLQSNEEQLFLKISDFDTKGMDGFLNTEKFNPNGTRRKMSPWHSYMFAEGISSKTSNTKGGSRGIGKNAPFMFTSVFSLTVSTVTEAGKAFQTISKTVNTSKNMETTEGNGHYCFAPANPNLHYPMPITEWSGSNIDQKLLRDSTSTGTTITIPAVKLTNVNKFIKDIIKVSIQEFLLAIFEKKLVISIKNIDGDEIVISKDTLSSLFSQYDSKAKGLFNVLASENYVTKDVIINTKKIGHINLYFALDDINFTNCIMLYRSIGMKINEIKYSIAKNYNFIGLLHGDELNSIVRSMENVEHTKLTPKLINDRKDQEIAVSVKNEITRICTDYLQEQIKSTLGESIAINMDIDGLEPKSEGNGLYRSTLDDKGQSGSEKKHARNYSPDIKGSELVSVRGKKTKGKGKGQDAKPGTKSTQRATSIKVTTNTLVNNDTVFMKLKTSESVGKKVYISLGAVNYDNKEDTENCSFKIKQCIHNGKNIGKEPTITLTGDDIVEIKCTEKISMQIVTFVKAVKVNE